MNMISVLPVPRTLICLTAGMALACCSCTTMKSMARTEDFSHEIQRARQQPDSVVGMSAAAPVAGVTRVQGKKQAPSEIQLVAHESFDAPPYSVTTCPPEPRMPAAGPNPFAIGMPQGELAEVPDPQTWPDEYLCDGGDREWPVHYDTQQRLGLDTEDTVAEYTDHKGRERMRPSNKVCVYAPRFAAVRTISQPVLSDGLQKSVGAIAATGETELRSKVGSVQKVKRDPVGGIRVRSRASGVETEAAGANVQQDVAMVQHDKINNLFQSFNFTLWSNLEQADIARLNYGLRAAASWSRESSPAIHGQLEQPFEGVFEVSATTLTVFDDQPSDEPGDLQILKLADRKDAKPGDVITFTIRYQNLGPREVHHVKIVDNLTPRLEYLEETTTSDRDISLDVEDNGEGSVVLTFGLDQSLPAKSSGIITFQAKVR